MSIAESIHALKEAKTNIANAIAAKGGTVNEGDGFSKFGDAIRELPSGASGEPISVSSEDEANALLVEANVGRIFKYAGEGGGGTENPTAVGDTIDKLYFNTSVTPDFSGITWGKDNMATYMYFETSGAGMALFDMTANGASGYLLMWNDSTFLYSSEELTSEFMTEFWGEEITVPQGWNADLIANGGVLTLDAPDTVSEIDNQSEWSSYISKEPFAAGAGAYEKDALYLIASGGGSSSNTHIVEGDTIDKLYFNTSVTPDLSGFEFNEGVSILANYRYDKGSNNLMVYDLQTLLSLSYPAYCLFAEVNIDTDTTGVPIPIYSTTDFNAGEVSATQGWQNLTDGAVSLGTTYTVTEVNQQDLWSSYISKEPFTGGGGVAAGGAYEKDALYLIAESEASGTPPAVGDTIDTLYFNTSVTPDFSGIEWDKDGLGTYMYFTEGAGLGVFDLSQMGVDSDGYIMLWNDSTFLYSSRELSSEFMEGFWGEAITIPQGWNAELKANGGVLHLDTPDTVSEIDNQDLWSSYISKEPFDSATPYAHKLNIAEETKVSKLALIAGSQSEPYDLTADDLRGMTELRSYAFMMSTGLNSIEIPSTVTAIREGAFYYCTGISNIRFESGSQMTSLTRNAFAGMAQNGFDLSLGDNGSLVEIGEYALSDSTIKSIDYGKNSQIQIIGDYAFRSCSRLTAIKIPKTITYLGASAFYSCSNLESVEFEEGVNLTEIKTRTFSSCSKLTKLSIPDGVINLGGYAFSGCSGLEDFVIPAGVTGIGERCFEGCSGLETVTIPASVTSIDTNAFNNCNLLNSVYYEGTLEQWCAITFSNETANPMYYATNLYINGELVEGNLAIPDGVTNINKYAFVGCDGLTSVSMPDSMTTIGTSAFSECSNLTSIDMPDSVTTIGSNAFRNCASLTSMTIPSGVTNISMGILSGCSSIESLAYPYSTTYQQPVGYIFGNTSYDGSIEVNQRPGWSDGLYYIPEKLKSVTITMGDVPENAFYECTNLTSVKLDDGVTTIGYSAFKGCTGLTSMIIPNSVTTIDGSAFSGCTGLTSITIPATVTTIGSSAFSGCTSLTSIDIPDGVTEIDDYTFSGCKSLASIVIPDNVTSIGDRAFQYCSSLTSVTFGENSKLTAIGSETFIGCSKLTSVVIPNGVTTIDKLAFADCDSLTSVVIPSSVTNIGNSVFWGNYDLVTVRYLGTLGQWCGITFGNHEANPATYAKYLYINNELIGGELIIPEGVTNIGTYAFYNWNNITSVTIPVSMSTIGDNAFLGCGGLVEVYNKSSLNIVAGNDDNGKVAYYALNVYTEEGGSKLSTDENGYVIYSEDDGVILVGYVGDETDLIVPENVTSINQFAFYERKDITSIIIPPSVTVIGEKAFYNCYNLFTVYNRSSLVIAAGATTHGYVAYYAKKVVSGTPSETFIFDAEGDEFIVTVKSTGAEIYRDLYHESNILSAMTSVVGEEDYDIELPTPTIDLTLTSGEMVMPYSTSNSFQFEANATHVFENMGLMGYRGADPSNGYYWRYSRNGGMETPFGGYGASMPFGANIGCGKSKIYAYAKISLLFDGVQYVSIGKSNGLEIEIV